MKKAPLLAVIVSSTVLLGGCDQEKVQQSKDTDHKKIEKTQEHTSHSEKHTTPHSSSQLSSQSSNAQTVKNNHEDFYTAQHLSATQKEAVVKQFCEWTDKQAKIGNMVTDSVYFSHGAAGNGDWFLQTVDGDMRVQQLDYPLSSGYSGNIIGGVMWYQASDGRPAGFEGGDFDPRGIPGNEKEWTPQVSVYFLSDNGKVYEINKSTLKGKDLDRLNNSDGLNLCGVGISEAPDPNIETSLRRPDTTAIVSEDNKAQEEYQRLLKEASGDTVSSTNWNSQKADALAKFVDQWAAKEGQNLEKGEVDARNYVKMGYQTWCTRDDYKEACTLTVPQMDGKDLNFTCNEPSSGQYQVVACYGPNLEKAKDVKDQHYYVFAIKDGKGVVLNTDNSSDVKPVDNQQLQQGFEKIVNQ